MSKAQRVKAVLTLAAIAAIVFYIGLFIWNEYQDARCESIIMELDGRDSAAAVKCFERFSSQ